MHTHEHMFARFCDSFLNMKSIRESTPNYSITISSHICYIAITILSVTRINALFGWQLGNLNSVSFQCVS